MRTNDVVLIAYIILVAAYCLLHKSKLDIIIFICTRIYRDKNGLGQSRRSDAIQSKRDFRRPRDTFFPL